MICHKLKPVHESDIIDIFEQAGLTDQAIVKHAQEGLNANKVISCNVIAKDGEGMKDANSMTKDFVDVPDWNARHKYFNTVMEMTDRIKHKVEHTNIGGDTKIYIISNKEDNAGIKGNANRLPDQISI